MAIATIPLTAQRWLDEVMFSQDVVNSVGGTFFSEQFRLPVGEGDVAIMEMLVTGFSLATVVVLPADIATAISVLSADALTVVDFVGVYPFYRVSSDEVRAYASPDPLVLWRQGELLTVNGPELDINVTPTGDLNVTVKCVRVRPGEPSRGAIQLVR